MTDRAITPVFRALADPTRRGILNVLRRGPLAVGDVASRFTMSRPAVSRHLRVLRRARLVVERRAGRHRVCELNPEPLRQVDDWIAMYRPLWTERLARLKQFVESDRKR
jgi:DNA-binding transcriptional ArsR family regulator